MIQSANNQPETITEADFMPVCLRDDRLEFFREVLVFANPCHTVQLWSLEGEGDSWDGASIPRWAWCIFGHPLRAEYRWASLWHDRLCTRAQSIEDRTFADALFLRLLRDAGVSSWRRLLMWMAVRIYGIYVWRMKGGGNGTRL